MNWEEYAKITRVLLDFASLTKEQRATILLMLDGLKYRQTEKGKTDD